jgi:type I restriction enzyme S subunit
VTSNWPIKQLQDISDVINGGTPDTKVKAFWDGEIRWITPAEMGKRKNPSVADTKRKITAKGLEKSSANVIPANSIILSTRAPIGHLVINEEPMAFNQGCRGIVPDMNCVTKYLYYYLFANVDLLNDLGTGTTFKELSSSKLKSVEIPLPTLDEQKRIVAILDEAFAGIDKAIANTERNLANAKELFESYLNSVFANTGADWEEKRLDEITQVKDGTHDSPQYQANGIPFITQKNIRSDGLIFDKVKYISRGDHDNFYRRSNVAPGDILISMIGANRGMAALVNDNKTFSIKNVGLIKRSEGIDNQFLLYYLKSQSAKQYVAEESNGGAQEFIGLTALRAFPVPYPRVKEQTSIVVKLDALSAETKKLEAIYQQKLADLAELKQAILQKAFTGELTGSVQTHGRASLRGV